MGQYNKALKRINRVKEFTEILVKIGLINRHFKMALEARLVHSETLRRIHSRYAIP